MSGPTFIYILQMLLACAWAVPLIRKTRPMLRVMSQRGRGDDSPRAVFWFVAAWVECGSLRWLIFPQAVHGMPAGEIAAWGGTYAFGILVALSVSLIFWERYYDGY